MKITRGAALIYTALGSLILYALAGWMFIAGFPVVGWVMIASGFIGWMSFLSALLSDVRAAKAETPTPINSEE